MEYFMVNVVAVNFVKKECVGEFIKTAAELVSETNKEAGCIAYDLYQDINCDQRLTFIECWESQGHLDAHVQSAHFKRIVPSLAGMSDPAGVGGATFYKKC